jgi:hypothetical protein
VTIPEGGEASLYPLAFLGEKAFKQELLAQMHLRRDGLYGPERREADPPHQL